jgi:hypothetical protein
MEVVINIEVALYGYEGLLFVANLDSIGSYAGMINHLLRAFTTL